jgi:hypothetical protein
MRTPLACFAAAALAGPAAACLNDKELPTHEREFRSNYHGPDRPSESIPPSALPSVVGGAALLLGVVMALYVGRSRS